MESIEAILKMNEKHPPGRRSTCIAELCARVEALEKENERLKKELKAERDERRRMASELLGGPLTPEELSGDYVLRGMPSDRQKPLEAPSTPFSGPSSPAPVPLPSDAVLLGFLEAYPGSSLALICGSFNIPYCYSPVYPRSDGAVDGGYTEECRAIRNQLQRLRRARKIRCESTRWEVW